MGGGGRSEGVETMGDRMLERALLVELGHQLGSGLASGATDITPEQQQAMESVVDGLLVVAAERTGKGLREEVSPELRDAVQRGIVDALADGLRGELGESLEETVDRVVHQAIVSLREGMGEQEMRFATADLLRESIYYAMREGQGGTPSVAETIEFTLTQNMLQPLEQSVGGITDRVAIQVEQQYRRTENLLWGIIGVMTMVLFGIMGLYLWRGRRLEEVKRESARATVTLGGLDAALAGLDDVTRSQITSKVEEYQAIAERAAGGVPLQNTPDPASRRGDDYMR